MVREPRTLASRIARRENAEFIGRARELLIVDVMFEPDAPASVLLVHGPGGIGKSVLLREIRRRGVAAGWMPFALDARDLPPVPDAVEQALAGAWTTERPLVLIDTYERMSALGSYLRSTLLPSLPANAVVVVAGRDEPEPGWSEGGWETVAVELPLAPFSAPRRARCWPAKASPTTRARARSRAGQAACRWRCGSARPPLARIRNGRRERTRRRCARTCGGCPTSRSRGSSPTCSRWRASHAWSRRR